MGGGVGEREEGWLMQPSKLQFAHDETHQTEFPIFVILCVLCFQR